MASPWGIVTGDFNNDQHTDIAVVNEDSPDVAVLLNDGSGGFSVATYPLSTTGFAIAAGDINGDGVLDLLVPLNNGTAGVAVLLGDSVNTRNLQGRNRCRPGQWFRNLP